MAVNTEAISAPLTRTITQVSLPSNNEGTVPLHNDNVSTIPAPISQSAAKRGSDYAGARDQVTSQSVVHPPSPDAYKSLNTGPMTAIEMEPNQQAPIDGSDLELRSLSPFMIQVELPIVFGQDGGFTNQSANNVNINTFDNANGVSDLYANARSSVAASGIGAYAKVLGLPATPNPDTTSSLKGADGKTTSATGQSNARLGFPAIADQNVAMDIATQLITALNVPPLVLLINPHQLQMSMTKIQSYQDRTRYGYIFHTWGEEQPKLTINTKCGAFISAGRGVQFASKRDSASWQNLMNMFRFYKNNGYIHDTVGKSNAHHFVGALSITYDGWIYYGHMESFSWAYEEAQQNGGIDFSIEFTVSRAIDTTQPVFAVTPMISPVPSPSDPRYFGAASVGNSGPNVYSVGAGGITSQNSISSVVSAMVPQDLKSFAKGGSTTPPNSTVQQPVGVDGFYAVNSTGAATERTVQQSSPGTTAPFQLG